MTLKVIHQFHSFSHESRRTSVQQFTGFQLAGASRGPSAIAELLVVALLLRNIPVSLMIQYNYPRVIIITSLRRTTSTRIITRQSYTSDSAPVPVLPLVSHWVDALVAWPLLGQLLLANLTSSTNRKYLTYPIPIHHTRTE